MPNPKNMVFVVGLLLVSVCSSSAAELTPDPPQIPRNFVGHGRYYVPDLDVDVPFSWQARNGDVHMIAGSSNPKDPIHFENIIYTDPFGSTDLYTITYKWPTPIPTPGECTRVRIDGHRIDLKTVNKFFATSSYVGREIIFDRNRAAKVNHFRASFVIPIPLDTIPPFPFVFRLPILSADLYVDPNNPRTFKKVLHFGLQNLYDEDLDEWFVMRTFKLRKGQVTLPKECERIEAADSVLDLGSAR